MQAILNESIVENIEGGVSTIPKTFALKQNYPNPFNPVTTIKYQIPAESRVVLSVYNILGQRIKTILNDVQPAGYYTVQWNGRDETGNQVASGIYFYRIQADGYVNTCKMLFMK